MYKTLIACLSNWNTLAEIPFVLKGGGCRVDILCEADAWVKSGSYYDNWIESKTQPDNFIKQLIEIVENDHYDWVILGDDLLIKLLNDAIDNDDLFRKILPISTIENRAVLSSKSGLSLFCEHYSIPTPRFVSLERKQYAFNGLIGKLNFPVIVKNDFGWGGGDIAICYDELTFEKHLGKVSHLDKIIVQEYVAGLEIPVEALYADGELIKYAVSKILTYDKDQFSYTTRRMYYSNTAIEKHLTNLGRSLGINGFANIAYIYSDINDLYYLIEVDLRPNSWIAMGKFTGNDFSEGVKHIVQHKLNPGEPYTTEKTNKIEQVEVALFYKDVRRALYNKDLSCILKWIFNYNSWKLIPLYDRKLFRRIIKELWDEIFVGKIKRILR